MSFCTCPALLEGPSVSCQMAATWIMVTVDELGHYKPGLTFFPEPDYTCLWVALADDWLFY